MRSIFIFTGASRGALEAALDSLGERQPDQWVIDGALYTRIDEPPDWSDGWKPESIRAVVDALGSEPARAVAVDISGRVKGWPEVRQLASAILSLGRGVVMDDYSDHPWRADELEEGHDEQGRRFFDPHHP